MHQASAGLPLTYFAFDPLRIFPGRGSLLGWLVDARVALVALPAFGLSFLCLRRRDEERDATAEPTSGSVPWLTSACLGLILAIVPTLVTAISPYHRGRIGPGVGWIAVLIEYYGVALLLSTAVWNVVVAMAGGGSRASWKCLTASMLVAGLVGVTYRANLDVVRCFNAPLGSAEYREAVGQSGGARDGQRRLLEAALASGLLADVPEHSNVQLSQVYPFWYDVAFSRFFYAAYARKSFNTLPPWIGAGLDGYHVREAVLGDDSGYVVLSRGMRAPLAPDDQPPSGGLKLYVRHPELARRKADAPFQVASLGAPTIAGRELRAIKSGRDWAIYSLEGLGMPHRPRIDPSSLRPAPPRLRRPSGRRGVVQGHALSGTEGRPGHRGLP